MVASRSPAAPASPITGWVMRRTVSTGGTFRSGWKALRSYRCRQVSHRTGCRPTSELITGFEFYPPIDKPAGTLAVQTILSSPETGTSTARTFYYLSIAAARRTIYIANPYFVPDQGAIDLLIAAKRRVVDVRIMVAGIYNDNWMARQNSVRLYGPLLEAGIQILEYNHTMLHQKTMVVDGVWATVGTTNFDSRSFAHNEENNVCFCDKNLARQLEEIFTADMKGCDVITLDGWRTRPFLAKSIQAVVSLLQEQV